MVIARGVINYHVIATKTHLNTIADELIDIGDTHIVAESEQLVRAVRLRIVSTSMRYDDKIV